MIEFEVTVEDADFRRRMERLPGSVSKWVQQGLQQTAQMVQARARQLAPVKTGRLMQSINVQMVDEYNFKVGCYVPYALYQEFGTRYIQPRYFLTRALQEATSQFLAAVGLNLQYALSEVSGI
ncbi:MAG: HK97 gp10 family phage protein [Candidatus Bathyarchaeia archaeon]